MNLLKLKNRFGETPTPLHEIHERNGYLFALQDILSLLEEKTGFKPENRFIDSVEILNAISETSHELSKRNSKDNLFITGFDHNSEKIKDFLRQGSNDDIPAGMFQQGK